jgi:5,10-methylenetetrahydromethanopterin reductase
MRLGLMLSGARPAPDAVRIAARAERSGIGDIWVSEDYFERGGVAVAAAVAMVTTTARIGIGVLNPWTRHPMLTAMEIAAIDELSGGRAVLGIGASNRVWMQERCGVEFTAPLRAVEECVDVVRRALSGEHVRVQGRHFQVDAGLSFVPLRASVPITLGVKGRRALELAGRIGDGVLLSLLAAPAYVSWARELTGPSLETSAYVLASCGPDRSAARAAVRRPLAYYLGVHGDHDITRIPGLDPALAARFRTGWLSGQPAEDLVGEGLIDTFAVAGGVHDCLAGLQRLEAAGLASAVLRDPGDDRVDALFSLAAAHRRGADRAGVAG